jgi:hypothetical protein
MTCSVKLISLKHRDSAFCRAKLATSFDLTRYFQRH